MDETTDVSPAPKPKKLTAKQQEAADIRAALAAAEDQLRDATDRRAAAERDRKNALKRIEDLKTALIRSLS